MTGDQPFPPQPLALRTMVCNNLQRVPLLVVVR